MGSFTETTVEERLMPQTNVVTVLRKPIMNHSIPYSLMRSASFNRIRQFPTYFCRYGSSDLFTWLFSSKTKLCSQFSEFTKQLHFILLTVWVYSALLILLVQIIGLAAVLVIFSFSIGFFFLVLCVLVMATMNHVAMKFGATRHQCRNRSRSKRE